MIAFDLACDCGFHFEGWFENRDDFVRQQTNGQLMCPQCGCASIRKILSPVAYQKKSFSTDIDPSSDGDGQGTNTHTDDLLRAASEVLQGIGDFVEKNFEDVGTEFTQKALKIHYGVEKPRNIRGVVGSDEEKLLRSEGVPLLKVPLLKQGNEKKH